MTFRRPIYRILFFAAWIVVLGGIAILVIAANRKTGLRTCRAVLVSVNGNGDRISVEKADVLKAIEYTSRGPVVGKPFAHLNLGALESALEANPWIRDAELYLDTKDALHVSVWERQPFARVFTTAGTSFYIDSSGFPLPLLVGYSARLPVVTGFTAAKKLSAKDSLTLQGVKTIVLAVSKDPFWNAQAGQIDITADRKFEIVPLVGSHVIKLGYAENIEAKLHNLLVFYKQVLPKAGLAKYSVLDAQFEGQVVAVRKGPTSVIDSIQLQKNIAELMLRKAAEEEPDDATQAVPVTAADTAAIKKDSVVSKPAPQQTTVEKISNTPATPDKTTNAKSNLQKSQIQTPKPVNAGMQKPPKQPIKKEASRPKAVMPSKAENEY